LELSIQRTGHLYCELIGDREVEILWPFGKPGHGFATLDKRGVDKELSWAIHGLCSEYRFPEPSSAGLGVVGVSAIGVAEVIRQQNQNIISKLSSVPIAEDLLSEDVA
jgi:hypothetical protein